MWIPIFISEEIEKKKNYKKKQTSRERVQLGRTCTYDVYGGDVEQT